MEEEDPFLCPVFPCFAALKLDDDKVKKKENESKLAGSSAEEGGDELLTGSWTEIQPVLKEEGDGLLVEPAINITPQQYQNWIAESKAAWQQALERRKGTDKDGKQEGLQEEVPS